jgi:regulator of replication initiation timing
MELNFYEIRDDISRVKQQIVVLQRKTSAIEHILSGGVIGTIHDEEKGYAGMWKSIDSKPNLLAEKEYLQSQISNLQSQISNLQSQISNLQVKENILLQQLCHN